MCDFSKAMFTRTCDYVTHAIKNRERFSVAFVALFKSYVYTDMRLCNGCDKKIVNVFLSHELLCLHGHALVH